MFIMFWHLTHAFVYLIYYVKIFDLKIHINLIISFLLNFNSFAQWFHFIQPSLLRNRASKQAYDSQIGPSSHLQISCTRRDRNTRPLAVCNPAGFAPQSEAFHASVRACPQTHTHKGQTQPATHYICIVS